MLQLNSIQHDHNWELLLQMWMYVCAAPPRHEIMVFVVPNRMAGNASSLRAIADDKVGAGDRAKIPYNAARAVIGAVREVHSGRILKFSWADFKTDLSNYFR